MNVAVIGGGAAGMSAAFHLVRGGARVHLLESGARLGGDCWPIVVTGSDRRPVSLDVGVSDFNIRTFVGFREILDTLDLRYAPICQDASFMRPDGTTSWFCHGGVVTTREPGVEAEALAAEMARFRVEAVEAFDAPELTLRDFLVARGYSESFRRCCVEPRAAGAFPMPNDGSFPLREIIAFWVIHGIVGGPPDRMAVDGGMHAYCDRMEQWLIEHGCRVRTNTTAIGVAKVDERVEIGLCSSDHARELLHVDYAVLATKPRHTLPLLSRPRPIHRQLLGSVRSQRATVYVHTDERLMPKDRDAWGAYNYIIADESRPTHGPMLTFFPKRLARLGPDAPDVFVSMNPPFEPAPSRIIAVRVFDHPVAHEGARALCRRIERELQGVDGLWLAGSYLQAPHVHEQAVQSGKRAAQAILMAA